MKQCGLVEDLLPLYVDGGCTEETTQFVSAHLQVCESCKEKYERMKTPLQPQPIPQQEEDRLLQAYGKRVKKGRVRRGALIVTAILLLSIAGILAGLTLEQMNRQRHPIVYEVEDGIWSLTAAALETVPEETEKYVLYTNSAQIRVEISCSVSCTGTVYLYDAAYPEPIQQHSFHGQAETVYFTGLSSSQRYILRLEGINQGTVTISEGRRTDFWSCFFQVLEQLGAALLNR